MPAVMYTFFDEYDFSGKTIIPFTTHGGSRLSGTPETIAELEPGATVSDNAFTVSRDSVTGAGEDEIRSLVVYFSRSNVINTHGRRCASIFR